MRSIKEICSPYYENDKEILAQSLQNKTPANVRRWIECDRSYCVLAENDKGVVVGVASVSGCEIMLNYVLPEGLHRGVQTDASALESHAIASGVEHIELMSTIPAKAFSERNGYVSNGPPKDGGRIIGDYPLSRQYHIAIRSTGHGRLRGGYRHVSVSAKLRNWSHLVVPTTT